MYLFLDIDGVMNSHKTWQLYGHSFEDSLDRDHRLDPTAVRFISLLARKGVKIVITSIWKNNKELDELKWMFDFPVHDKTETYPWADCSRGDEIYLYLLQNRPAEKFCIVDDDPVFKDMNYRVYRKDLEKVLVNTDYSDGLQLKHMEAICEHLGFEFSTLLTEGEKETKVDIPVREDIQFT